MESVTCECGWWKEINVLGSSSHAMPCVITSWRFHYHYYHNLLNNTCCFNIHREINIVTEFIVLSYLPGSSGRPESHSNKLAHTEGQNKIQTFVLTHTTVIFLSISVSNFWSLKNWLVLRLPNWLSFLSSSVDFVLLVGFGVNDLDSLSASSLSKNGFVNCGSSTCNDQTWIWNKIWTLWLTKIQETFRM